MSPTAAGLLVAVIGTLITIAAIVWRDGRRDGRVDAVLERLTHIAEDHEIRLRAVERRRPGSHRRTDKSAVKP